MGELTVVQIERQDFVDNAVFNLISSVNPSNKQLNWDIEMIGDVRDLIRYWLTDRLKSCDEMTFYPYLD